jgi:DNA adenine methylase
VFCKQVYYPTTKRLDNLGTLGFNRCSPPSAEFSAVHLRLSRVYVENKPFDVIIKRFDKPDTLFYCDPPYHRFEDYYGKGVFSRKDFKTLRDILASIKDKFIMSINDTPEIRTLYKGFQIETVSTSYSAAGANKKKKVNELLIMNYKSGKLKNKNHGNNS